MRGRHDRRAGQRAAARGHCCRQTAADSHSYTTCRRRRLRPRPARHRETTRLVPPPDHTPSHHMPQWLGLAVCHSAHNHKFPAEKRGTAGVENAIWYHVFHFRLFRLVAISRRKLISNE